MGKRRTQEGEAHASEEIRRMPVRIGVRLCNSKTQEQHENLQKNGYKFKISTPGC